MALHDMPDPRLHDWETWVDTVVSNNPAAIRVMDASEVDDNGEPLGWRDIADRLILLEPTAPRHDSFPDWREWAINLMAIFPG